MNWYPMPPSSGPTMRVVEPVTESSAIARAMRRPATSPTMRRRVDISVDHTVPLTKPASARCQGRAIPPAARAATVAADRAETASAASSSRLRFTASETTPASAPNSSIGMVRAAETTATASPEPVTSSVNSAAASTSSQRIELPASPIIQRRKKPGERNRAPSSPWPVRVIAAWPPATVSWRAAQAWRLLSRAKAGASGARVSIRPGSPDQLRGASFPCLIGPIGTAVRREQGMNDSATPNRFDRGVEDLGNVVELGHVNVTVPDQRLATLFYISGLGLTRDPYLMTGVDNMWANVGRSQFHLPVRAPQVVRGVTGLVLPDIQALLARLAGVRKHLEGTKFAFQETDDGVMTTCPWGNRIRCHAPDEARFGPLRLGMP